LNYLSKKINIENFPTTGEYLLNGQKPDEEKFTRISSYVMQEDILEPLMTPKQILLFTAKLKLNLSPQEIEERVRRMIKDLNLHKCKNTPIGNQFIRGVSGGERKRTSIGVELISDPTIVFLDEPTTGLDSYNAYQLILLLEGIAKSGKIVIYTIHQPASQIFNLLDNISIMALGKTIYFGPQFECIPFFELMKIPVPLNYNPFEHFLEVTNITAVKSKEILDTFPELTDIDSIDERYEKYIEILNSVYEKYKDSYLETKLSPEIDGIKHQQPDNTDLVTNISCFYQFGLLFGKNVLNSVNNKNILFVKFAQTIISSIFLALLFTRVYSIF
jgi:ABC-type multidrug transport system ATPase subunit